MKKEKGKIKILFVIPTPPPYSGLEVMSEFFMESSLKNEFDIIHLSSNLNNSNRRRGKLNALNFYRYISLCWRLSFIIIKEKPKVIYTILSENITGFMRSSGIILLGKLFNKKIVVHLYGSNLNNFYNNSNIVLKNWIKYVLKHADRAIVLGNVLKKQFEGIYPLRKIRVVYNGIPKERFALSENRFSTNVDEVKVLFLGHVSQAKGFNDIIKAIPLVFNKTNIAKFIFAGERIKAERHVFFDAYNRKIVFEKIDKFLEQLQKKYSSKINIIGSVREEEKNELLLQADIFVLPSYSEGFPVAILEAMANGLPIITTPVGALPEVLKDGVHCFFVPIANHQKLADFLIYLVNNPEIRSQIGQNNYSYVREKLNIDKSAEAMAAIFREVVASDSSFYVDEQRVSMKGLREEDYDKFILAK